MATVHAEVLEHGHVGGEGCNGGAGQAYFCLPLTQNTVFMLPK